jgi:hypothetical protein
MLNPDLLKMNVDPQPCVGNLSPAMGARNQVGIGMSYLPPANVAWLLNSRPGSWN